MKKLTVLCDLDGIVAGLLWKWLKRYNDDHNDAVAIEHLTSYQIHEHVKIGTDIYRYIAEDGFFEDIEPIPGSIDVLTSFAAKGHDVIFATSPSHNAQSAQAKIEWVERHFKFKRQKVILIHPKYLLRGDVFIDDDPDKLIDHRNAWPQTKLITISYPYNTKAHGVCDLVANGYDDYSWAWRQIGAYLDHLAAE